MHGAPRVDTARQRAREYVNIFAYPCTANTRTRVSWSVVVGMWTMVAGLFDDEGS